MEFPWRNSYKIPPKAPNTYWFVEPPPEYFSMVSLLSRHVSETKLKVIFFLLQDCYKSHWGKRPIPRTEAKWAFATSISIQRWISTIYADSSGDHAVYTTAPYSRLASFHVSDWLRTEETIGIRKQESPHHLPQVGSTPTLSSRYHGLDLIHWHWRA